VKWTNYKREGEIFMNKIKVVKIEYETKDKTLWKACVLAYSIDEAIKAIINTLPTYDRLISTSMIGEVDMVSKAVYNDYFNNVGKVEDGKDNKLTEGNIKSNVKKSSGKTTPIKPPPAPVKEETKPKDKNTLVCPICSKEYKTQKTLINHMNKMHT
jgi:acetate kinase